MKANLTYEQELRRVAALVVSEGVRVESRLGSTWEVLGLRADFSLRELLTREVPSDVPEYAAALAAVPTLEVVMHGDVRSRRAYAYIGSRDVKTGESECFTSLQVLARRVNRVDNREALHVFAYARSLDVLGKFPRDVLAIAHGLAPLAKSLGLEPGVFSVFAASAHVYVA